MARLDHKHVPDECIFFIDSIKISLKAVLLNNGNKFSCMLLAYDACINQTCNALKQVLDKIKCTAYIVSI